MPDRRLYKLILWDYGTDRGIATDGTAFEGEPIPFHIYAKDLSPEHNGHLLRDEVFSAVESCDHILYDIVIERGPRSLDPANRLIKALPSLVDERAPPFDTQLPLFQEESLISSLSHRVATLEERVDYLEAHVSPEAGIPADQLYLDYDGTPYDIEDDYEDAMGYSKDDE